jgi:hypothetical protein
MDEKVLRFPEIKSLCEWEDLQKILEQKGNSQYVIDGVLNLWGTPLAENTSKKQIIEKIDVRENVMLT